MQLFIKNVFGSGTTILIISNKEMGDIIKIIKSLEEPDLLIKSVSETNKNETKEQRRISQYVIRNIRCYVIWELINR